MPFDIHAIPPLYLILPALLIVGVFVRRVPVIGTLVTLATWLALIGTVALLIGDRQRFDPYLGKIVGALNLGDQQVVGKEVRIRMSPDGHFWARASLDGTERRMLIDSGATVTALSPATAAAAGLEVTELAFPVILNTANGTIRAQTARVATLKLGNVVARDVDVVVAPGLGDTDVIGMNLLSRLKSWRVEGKTLVLVPHHPQGKAA